MQRGLAEAKSLMEFSGIPSPGHKTGLPSQTRTDLVMESNALLSDRLEMFLSRGDILLDSIGSLTLNQKGLNLGQGVATCALAIRWLKRLSIFNHAEGHPHKSSGSSDTSTIFGLPTLYQPIGEGGKIFIVIHKGIANVNADVTQVSGAFFGNGTIGRLSVCRLESGGIKPGSFNEGTAIGILFKGGDLSSKFSCSYWTDIVNAKEQYCWYAN
ncbi:hypothetical protein M1O56_06430 [Dehalococcoidia bacterium]|nr:hypothetical protein [Dehalococcoidia bacterium]